jgi:thiamine kinase-like enzyme
MIEQRPSGLRVCPVDWETAAIGPGLMDLAALITGWSDRSAADIATAYYSVMCAAAAIAGSHETFLADLACCRIQLAVQWLGWFGSHRPPPAHARGWLEEATRLADRL